MPQLCKRQRCKRIQRNDDGTVNYIFRMCIQPEQVRKKSMRQQQQRRKDGGRNQNRNSSGTINLIFIFGFGRKAKVGGFNSISKHYIQKWNGGIYQAHFAITRSGKL